MYSAESLRRYLIVAPSVALVIVTIPGVFTPSMNVSDDCVVFFVTGEDECPNFNLCDYALGFEHLEYGDRYLRFPLYYFYKDDKLMTLFLESYVPIKVATSSRLNILFK